MNELCQLCDRKMKFSLEMFAVFAHYKMFEGTGNNEAPVIKILTSSSLGLTIIYPTYHNNLHLLPRLTFMDQLNSVPIGFYYWVNVRLKKKNRKPLEEIVAKISFYLRRILKY